ncbi:unnamed protein product [Rhodiola kirilowii]
MAEFRGRFQRRCKYSRCRLSKISGCGGWRWATTVVIIAGAWLTKCQNLLCAENILLNNGGRVSWPWIRCRILKEAVASAHTYFPISTEIS